MNARNRRRLEALEQQMAAPKGEHGYPLIVEWHGKGGPKAWAMIQGQRMTPQEVSKFYRQYSRRAKWAEGDPPLYLEVYLSDLPPRDERRAGPHADADADADAEDDHHPIHDEESK